jgi:hypothetical protein
MRLRRSPYYFARAAAKGKSDFQVRFLATGSLPAVPRCFPCAGLGWVPGTSPKRIRVLRAEFKKPYQVRQVRKIMANYKLL